MLETYTFREWTISNKNGIYTANNGKGFFTGYYECDNLSDFIEILERL